MRGGAITSFSAATMRPIKALHSGRIGDYTAALVLGVGALGALFTITLR